MKKNASYSHGNHRPAIMTMAIITVAVVFCSMLILNINQKMNESATSNMLNTTRVIEGNLENAIEKDFESLKVIGELSRNKALPTGETLYELCSTMGFEWLGAAKMPDSEEGRITTTFDVEKKFWYEQWKPGEKGYSSAYYGDSGRLQTTLWLPVYEDGELIGTVFGEVLLSRYYSANVFTFYNGEGRTYVFKGSDGKWILKSLGVDGLANSSDDIYTLLTNSGNASEDVGAFRQAVEEKKTGTVEFNFNGQLSYICFMPMTSSDDWYVVTVVARDVLLREAVQIQKMIRILLLVFFLAIIICAFGLIKWQKRQIKLKEIHYRESLFANIFSNVDSVFLIYEKDRKEAVFVSDNMKRVLGLDREDIKEDVGKLFDWFGIGAADPIRAMFLEGTLNKPEVSEVCMENALGAKSRFIRLEFIPADLGQEIVVITDITSDKDIQNSLTEAMKRAEAASHAKNEFLSAMSHDIRTPMNGIIGMTAIAAVHLDDKNRVRDCLNKISDASSQLLNLINEILDMSRIESGKMELSEEPFNLPQQLQEVLDLNFPWIKQKNHMLSVRIQSMDHEQVIGDLGRMQRIATNLISNAIKYTPDGGNISVVLKENPQEIKGYGCYELTVKDNGIGMSAEFQKRLFQPFEREEDVRLSKIQGTGLGMSIVKSIVGLMMGHIEVESEKDKGTTFRVTVNLKLDECEKDANHILDKLPVLVVDDDVDVCESVSQMLFDIGMTGEWADNGAEAVRMVADRHFAEEDYLAVLVDWKMPEMDGVETARRIRAVVDDSVPVIILTAYDWSEIEEEAVNAGVDAFLSKPLYKSKLMQKMLTIVDRSVELPLTERILYNKIPAGKRVLLAEDNQLNQEIAVEILGQMNLKIDTAGNGAEAVKKFADSEPGFYDIILMDIQMPVMNGYEAARTIRRTEHKDSQKIPIVAMTADAFAKDVQAAYASGMNEHISKPVSVDRLVQVLERFLKN